MKNRYWEEEEEKRRSICRWEEETKDIKTNGNDWFGCQKQKKFA